jgi:hypothetical protein
VPAVPATILMSDYVLQSSNNGNLAKLDNGLTNSPTVLVGEKEEDKLGKNRGILKPSWAFVETNTSFHNQSLKLENWKNAN